MNIKNIIAVSSVTAFGPFLGYSAIAQETGGVSEAGYEDRLSDIIVTAQKRAENMQKVPIAISAVSPAQLENRAVVATEDLGKAVPGLVILNTAGILQPRLRGIGTQSVSAGNESPVATYIDGVYIVSGADININMSDVAQVAVLKGPQGTLFGRNATGGVLQFTTRDPSQDFELDATTGIDNYATWRSHLYAGGGVSTNLAAGFSVSYVKQGDGWGKNIVTGNDIRKIDDDLTLRGKLVFDNGPTNIKLAGDYHYGRNSNAPAFRPFPGLEDYMPFPVPQPRNKWSVVNIVDPVFKHDGYGASLTVKQDVGIADLVSITAYRDSSAFYRFVSGPTSVPLVYIDINYNSKQFTQEVQLVSRSGGAFNWAIGAYYFWNNANANPDGQIVYVLPANLQSVTTGRQITNSIAGFAQGTLKVTDSTRFTAGFRYTYEKKDGLGSGYTRLLATGTIIPTFTDSKTKLSFEKPTWRLAVDQDIGPNVIVYASYNRGFKSGGISPTNFTQPPFKPEKIDAFEVGFKSDLFDRKARFNAAAFYYDYTNIQVNRYLPTGTAVTYNGEGAEIYGIDADFEAKISSRLHLNGGLTWLIKADFLSFPEAQFSIPNLNAGPTFFVGDATGHRVPHSPKLTYTVGIDYEIGNFLFNVNDSYNSGYFGDVDNFLKQGSFHFIGASATWTSDNQKYSVRLWGNNLLDKAVISQMPSVARGYEASYPNAPRTYGVTLSAKY